MPITVDKNQVKRPKGLECDEIASSGSEKYAKNGLFAHDIDYAARLIYNSKRITIIGEFFG